MALPLAQTQPYNQHRKTDSTRNETVSKLKSGQLGVEREREKEEMKNSTSNKSGVSHALQQLPTITLKTDRRSLSSFSVIVEDKNYLTDP